eukprot:11736252-Alexandrium_andersonii.AAC.1
MSASLVGSEMCIRDSPRLDRRDRHLDRLPERVLDLHFDRPCAVLSDALTRAVKHQSLQKQRNKPQCRIAKSQIQNCKTKIATSPIAYL